MYNKSLTNNLEDEKRAIAEPIKWEKKNYNISLLKLIKVETISRLLFHLLIYVADLESLSRRTEGGVNEISNTIKCCRTEANERNR